MRWNLFYMLKSLDYRNRIVGKNYYSNYVACKLFNYI